MARRSPLEELLRRIVYGEGGEGYYIVLLDRLTASGTARLPLSEVEKVTRDYLYLRDGAVIPVHRVIEVRGPRGELLWSRVQRSTHDAHQ